MAVKFQYGPAYQELTPPLEWEEISVKSTINDSVVEATIDVNSFTFVGDASTYLRDEFIPTYGVFRGCEFRIILFESGNVELLFDGFIDLRTMENLSITGPNLIRSEIKSFNDNVTLFDQMAVQPVGLLYQQGHIGLDAFNSIKMIRVPKKDLNLHVAQMVNHVYAGIIMYANWILNFLSAIADISSFGIVIGLIELTTWAINAYIEAKQWIQTLRDLVDLLFPTGRYYTALKVKEVVEGAFGKFGTAVEWGIIEDVIDKLYVIGSRGEQSNEIYAQNLYPYLAMSGNDYGSYVGELLDVVKKMFNTREDVRDGVAHIKTRKDPYWTTAPVFQPPNLVVEQTKQYKNGVRSNNTDEVYGITRISYQYDTSDGWTLTQNNGDTHEVHLDLIQNSDPRLNLLRGINDIQIPYAMPVRHNWNDETTKILEAVLIDAFNFRNEKQEAVQIFVDLYVDYLDFQNGGEEDFDAFNQMEAQSPWIPSTDGGLQVEDFAWAVPKIFVADKIDSLYSDHGVLKVPENHLDEIKPENLYNKYYFFDSPAIENNFKGQYTWIKNWSVPFSLDAYQKTINNPDFIFDTKKAKFTFINFNINDRKAVSNVKINEVFDTNITEKVVP